MQKNVTNRHVTALKQKNHTLLKVIFNSVYNQRRAIGVLVMQRCCYYCRHRDPNTGDSAGSGQNPQFWPKYTIDDRKVLVLTNSSQLHIQNGLRDRYCQFWSESVPELLSATGTNFLRYVMSFSRWMFIRIGLIMTPSFHSLLLRPYLHHRTSIFQQGN